jgi:hypothetical protein
MRINKVEYDQIVASMQHVSTPRQFHPASVPEGVTVMLHAGNLYIASPVIDVGFGASQWLHVNRASLSDGPARTAMALQAPSNHTFAEQPHNPFSAYPMPTSFWDQNPNTVPSAHQNISATASLLGSHIDYVKMPTPTILHNSQPTPWSTPATEMVFSSQIRDLNPKELAAYSSRWTPLVKTRQEKALERLQKARARKESLKEGTESTHPATSQNGKAPSEINNPQGAKKPRRYLDASGNEVPPGTAGAKLAATHYWAIQVDPWTGSRATEETERPIPAGRYRDNRRVNHLTGEPVKSGKEKSVSYKQFVRGRPVDVETGIEVLPGTKGSIPRKEYERRKKMAAKKAKEP